MTVLRHALAPALAFSAVWLGACGPGPAAGAAPRPRHAILISIDTLRADHLGCYGSSRPTSPHLDELATQGTLFEKASAAAPWTLPAHVTMFTGLYPSEHGVDGFRKVVPADLPVLSEQLKRSGFATAGIYNANMLGAKRGFGRGFDTWTCVPKTEAPAGATTAVVDQALDWIAAQQGRPFFLFLHFYDVHSDYASLPEFQSQFAQTYAGPADGTTAQLNRYRAGELSGWGAAEAEHLAALYDAGIRQLDEQLARLWQGLHEAGLWDDTLIVVTADHGEEFLEHGGVLHDSTLYEEQIHIPLLIVGPGVPRGLRVSAQASQIDLMPTLLSLLGANVPSGLPGLDLSLAWRAPERWPADRAVFAEADRWYAMPKGDLRRSVRAGRFKLTYDKATDSKRLFDLEADPHERLDISAQRPELTQSLWAKLEGFMRGGRELQETLTLPPQEREALEALGYVEGEDGESEITPAADENR